MIMKPTYYALLLVAICVEANREDGKRYLLMCSKNGTECREVNYPPLSLLLEMDEILILSNELTRAKRDWAAAKEPICKLACDCAPDFVTSVDQSGSVEQVAKQEQLGILNL